LDIRNETGVDGIGIQTGTVSGIYLEINGNETENGNYLTGVRRNWSINITFPLPSIVNFKITKSNN